jgi:hypothetical protein
MLFEELSEVQKNVLIGSIIGDGEITKRYSKSRRKNNSYREHFSIKQLEYREWKVRILSDLLYLRSDNTNLVSKSIPLFTNLYNLFYNDSGNKIIPSGLFSHCKLPHFLVVLFMDDGSLCISKRINHRKKLIYISPYVSLYLQNYPKNELTLLQRHLNEQFSMNFKLNKRKDGYGYILKLTKVSETLKLLEMVNTVITDCLSMRYKYDWEFRLNMEANKYQKFLNYNVISTDSFRFQNYSDEEIHSIINLQKSGKTDKEISKSLNRSYWSIVYKLREIRKDGHL